MSLASSARLRPLVVVVAVVALVLVAALPAFANGGWLTPKDPYITLAPGLPAGSSVKAIMSAGEEVDGVRFQGIPDGIGIRPGPTADTVDVYLAHEESTVPFRGAADFQDASVNKLTLNTAPGPDQGEVLAAEVAISADNGYLRFCSASMAGPAEGFSSYVYFTGEESNDIVDVPTGAPYGSDESLAPQRQAGYAVALDTDTGYFTQVPGMGRLNHENTIALPGYDRIVLLTTDDTFTAPSAQLYMYLADYDGQVFEDKGSLWAFRVDRTEDGQVKKNDPFNDANDYLDIQPGDDWQGEFIRVPQKIARGLTDIAPQDALEQWSNENNVFQFIRLEDLAFDKSDPRVVYVADTGATRVVPDPETGRMKRGPGGTAGLADNGRIFKFVFNPDNPRKVDSLSVFADGDAPSADVYVPFISPDNLDTSASSLMVQEDTSNARIWRHDFATGSWSVVATVNDPDGESSGIVDASAWFGPGAWLLDVQAHGSNVIEMPDPENPSVLLKLEDGQLMLMTIPGS